MLKIENPTTIHTRDTEYTPATQVTVNHGTSGISVSVTRALGTASYKNLAFAITPRQALILAADLIERARDIIEHANPDTKED